MRLSWHVLFAWHILLGFVSLFFRHLILKRITYARFFYLFYTKLSAAAATVFALPSAPNPSLDLRQVIQARDDLGWPEYRLLDARWRHALGHGTRSAQSGCGGDRRPPERWGALPGPGCRLEGRAAAGMSLGSFGKRSPAKPEAIRITRTPNNVSNPHNVYVCDVRDC